MYTKKAALQKCITLWAYLADTGQGEKSIAYRELGWPSLDRCHCPACQYTSERWEEENKTEWEPWQKGRCEGCPMDWAEGTTTCAGIVSTFPSPYAEWTQAIDKAGRRELAIPVLEAAERGLEKVIQEEAGSNEAV